MTKPLHVCGRDGCGERAQWQAVVVLRGSPLKGATTIRVCDRHKRAGEEFVLNDENRSRLVSHLIINGFCDALTAHGMVKHNALVEYEAFAS